ncbi:hypothetical protein PINS_up002706 [Pythium insidiosum]|nr:hypothetical protein PINS_up002706 [Pythium insidiosum]
MAATSVDSRNAASSRPRVALLYTHKSASTREGEFLAAYLGLVLATTQAAESVAVVAVKDRHAAEKKESAKAKEDEEEQEKEEKEHAALRVDGVVVQAKQLKQQQQQATDSACRYVETGDVSVLKECHVWILCVDADATTRTVQMLKHRGVTAPMERVTAKGKKVTSKRVIISLQPALRRVQELEEAFPNDTVLHGGACFHLARNQHGVLYPLSHGCFFIERLNADKTHALFAIDLLESAGVDVLSRKDVQALKWGHSALRLFYYVNALTGRSVLDDLRDRACRLMFLELLHEVSTVLCTVANTPTRDGRAASRVTWALDLSAATYVSLSLLMALLPLPNWLFNGVVLRLADVGLSASRTGVSTIARDVEHNRATAFDDEFDDVFTLAESRALPVPTLTALRETLRATHAAQNGTPRVAGHVLLHSLVPSSSRAPGRAVARSFWLKVSLSVVAVVLLLTYLWLLR